jgi:pyridoxal phosphate enzyme (YggS family)
VKTLVERIYDNYSQVVEQIGASARRSGRDPEAIRVVVVSKAQPLEVLAAAIQAGIRRFGENYPEEAVEKIARFGEIEHIEWHMIGHLQSRKSRMVAGAFDYFHSLDSLNLARKLNAALIERDKSLPVFLEMNVSGEQSKYGWPAWEEGRWDNLVKEVEQLIEFPQVKVCGLMVMPPLFNDQELSRPYFSKARKLRNHLARKLPMFDLSELSMGTSADYCVAIEEGATFVRIGQAILGPRPAK